MTVRPTVYSRACFWWVLMILSAEMLETKRLMLLITRPSWMMPSSSKTKRNPRPASVDG